MAVDSQDGRCVERGYSTVLDADADLDLHATAFPSPILQRSLFVLLKFLVHFPTSSSSLPYRRFLIPSIQDDMIPNATSANKMISFKHFNVIVPLSPVL